eukprot:TRINITY_DN8589_c0_g1_i11.p1 TRINITY_DN8589_c0_g1~~TRINITY_DN8589_c0_g1_i11.p1  ORF type:complete len:515 (-),score=76.81 TRINITY_DN8589_c0_g1_i11:199-1743(-)
MLVQIFGSLVRRLPSLGRPLHTLNRSQGPAFKACHFPAWQSTFVYRASLFSTGKDDGENKKQAVIDFSEDIKSAEELKEKLEKMDIGALDDKDKEHIFQTREQKLSIQLMKASSWQQVLNTYENENNKEKLNVDEMCLIFYFTCLQEGEFAKDARFIQVMENVLDNLEQLNTIYFTTFIWCLGGTLLPYHKVTLSENYKLSIERELLKRINEFPLNQLSTLLLGITQIFSSSQDLSYLQNIIKHFLAIGLQKPELLVSNDIVNYLMVLTHARHVESSVIELLKLKALEFLYQYDATQISKLISCFGDLGVKDKELYLKIHHKVSEKIEEFSPDDLCYIILTYSSVLQDRKSYLHELLKRVHSHLVNINITSYIHLWLAMAKYQVDLTEFEKSLRLMKAVIYGQKAWSIKELEAHELSNIIVSMATLRMNDKVFLAELIPYVVKSLEVIQKDDLFNLARSFLIYHKQFEDCFVNIHETCVKKLDEFTESERKILQDAFVKTRHLFVKSPFLDGLV